LGQERPPEEADLERIMEIASRLTTEYVINKVPRDFLAGINVKIEMIDPEKLVLSVNVDIDLLEGNAEAVADDASQYCIGILDTLINMHLAGQLNGRSNDEIIAIIQGKAKNSDSGS
jgi:hypothetical protein